MKKLFFLYSLFFTLTVQLSAQELNCQVQVTSAIKDVKVEPRIFKTLEQAIKDFLNTRKWTDDNFGQQEKINCSLFLTITEVDASKPENVTKAQLTIQSSRPVFGTTYSSPVTTLIDKSIQFTYRENDPIEFSENNVTSNLSALLTFYAYVMIGYDYDTYALKGGSKYFQKAEDLTTIFPFNYSENGMGVSGWRPTDGSSTEGQRNRYWLINQIQNSKYETYRNVLYTYHLKGMDLMQSKPAEGTKKIVDALTSLEEMSRGSNGGLYITQVFTQSKADEIINIFFNTPYTEYKKTVFEKISKIDPTNADKYQKIMKSN